MLIAECFLSSLINKYGKHHISTDGGAWYPPQVKFLKLRHHLHSLFEKSIMERTMQYINDRTEEGFDNYFSCKKNKYKLKHIEQWLCLFIDQYNEEIFLKLTVV